MKSRKMNRTIAGAVAVAALLGGTAVIAASDAIGETTQQQELSGPLFPLRVSEDAATALDGVNAARMALMQWSGDHARDVLWKVKDLIGGAADGVTASDLAKADTSAAALKDSYYYPVAYQTRAFETFSAPPADADDQAVASEEMAQVQAGEEISGTGDDADINDTVRMSVTVAFLPKDATLNAVDEAISKIDAGDLAGADVTLAAISNSILVSTMSQQATSG